MKIAITGMGIISSVGNTVEENYEALLNKKAGISQIQNFETLHKDAIKVGEIKLNNKELSTMLGLSENNNFSRTAMLGAYAAKKAIENASIFDLNEYKTGLISATSVGGMDMTERYYYEYFKNPALQKYIEAHDAGNSSHKIADYIGLKGFVSTVSTACSSAANAIMLGARMIASRSVRSSNCRRYRCPVKIYN
nr:beta-ketoacyl synthase N-terminal-like domain-containing protein [Flavobacterium covae]